MTIQEAINDIDRYKANLFTNEDKIKWISRLDGLVYTEIFLRHEGVKPGTVFKGYTPETSLDTVLLAPEPYTEIYQYYMAVQMDLTNRETGEYAKDSILFDQAWEDLSNYWTRTHMPISTAPQFRF